MGELMSAPRHGCADPLWPCHSAVPPSPLCSWSPPHCPGAASAREVLYPHSPHRFRQGLVIYPKGQPSVHSLGPSPLCSVLAVGHLTPSTSQPWE